MSKFTRIIHDVTSRFSRDNTAGTGFPYSSPTASSSSGQSTGLFQENVLDTDLYSTYERNPIAKVIVADVAEDVFDKGFKVVNVNTEVPDTQGVTVINGEEPAADPVKLENKDEELNTVFQEFYELNLRQAVIRAYKLARLYGYSLLLIGYNDELPLHEEAILTSPIKYFQPIPKDWISEIEYVKNEQDEIMLPVRIKRYVLSGNGVDVKSIHPSRVIHFENPGLDTMAAGESALMACFDDLVVLKHVTWGAGQTMWRSGNQMVTVIAPPRATTQQIGAIDSVMADVNAKSAFTFPFGTEVTTHTPTGLNPSPYAEIPLNNISACTRIPISILIGSQAGALAASLTDQRDYAGTLSAIQNNVLTPILMKLFKKLQYTKQLPFTSFKIAWVPTLTMSEPEKTLVDYREALTKRINMQVEMESAQLNSERASTGSTLGVSPETIQEVPSV